MVFPGNEKLVEHARRHLDRFEGGLPPALQSIWSQMIQTRIGGREERYLLHPLAQPLLSVPLWAIDCAGGAETVGDGMLADVVGASVVGYHGVRLQDDLIDEQAGDPIMVMLLSAVALSHADGLLARHVQDHRFWDAHSEIMGGYADAMQFERLLRSDPETYDATAFDRVLRRSRPLAIPGLAILARAGEWELAGRFEELVRHAARAVQMANDLRDAPTDLENENHTWVLSSLGVVPGSGSFEQSLISGFDAVVRLVDDELQTVADMALSLGADTAVSWSRSASTELARFQTEFWTKLFRAGAGMVSHNYDDRTR